MGNVSNACRGDMDYLCGNFSCCEGDLPERRSQLTEPTVQRGSRLSAEEGSKRNSDQNFYGTVLQGTNHIPTRIFSEEDIFWIVRLQANIRRFLIC